MRVGVFGGTTVTSGEYADLAGNGYHVGGGLWLAPIESRFAGRAELAYHGLGQQRYVLGANTYATKPAMVTITIAAQFMLRAEHHRLRPYLVGGGGIYRIRSATECVAGSCGGIRDTDGQEHSGLHGGAGVQVELRSISFYTEARWHSVGSAIEVGPFSDPTRRAATFTPITFGVTFR